MCTSTTPPSLTLDLTSFTHFSCSTWRSHLGLPPVKSMQLCKMIALKNGVHALRMASSSPPCSCLSHLPCGPHRYPLESGHLASISVEGIWLSKKELWEYSSKIRSSVSAMNRYHLIIDWLHQDGHNDLLIFIRAKYQNHIYNNSDSDFAKKFENGGLDMHVDIPRLEKGLQGGAFWSAFWPCPLGDGTNFSDSRYSDSNSSLRNPSFSLQH